MKVDWTFGRTFIRKEKKAGLMRKKSEKGAPTQQQIKRAQGEAVEIGKDYA